MQNIDLQFSRIKFMITVNRNPTRRSAFTRRLTTRVHLSMVWQYDQTGYVSKEKYGYTTYLSN